MTGNRGPRIRQDVLAHVLRARADPRGPPHAVQDLVRRPHPPHRRSGSQRSATPASYAGSDKSSQQCWNYHKGDCKLGDACPRDHSRPRGSFATSQERKQFEEWKNGARRSDSSGARRPDSPTVRSPRGKVPGVCRQWEKYGTCQLGPQNCKFQHPEHRKGILMNSGRGDDGARRHDNRDRRSGSGGGTETEGLPPGTPSDDADKQWPRASTVKRISCRGTTCVSLRSLH